MSDLTKTPIQILLDLINADNPGGGTLLAAEVSFSAPSVNVGARNTLISATALDIGSGQRFAIGSNTSFFYNRLDLQTAVLAEGNSVFEKTESVTTVDHVIALVNARYGLNLTVDDYTISEFPTFVGDPDEQHDLTITAKANSLVYVGEGVVTLKIFPVGLTEAFSNSTLNGLTYEPPGGGP